MFGFVAIAVIGSIGFAAYNYFSVKKRDPGTELMKEISGAIREGADTFIMHEFYVILKIAILISIALMIFVSWYTGVTFLIGATMSQLAAFLGMDIATIANVRVSNTARETKSLGSTLKVAFQGGSVMGLAVGGFALLGLGLVYLIFGKILGQTEIINLQIETNWLGISYIPFAMSVSGYALGCSIIAMFNRVGGGIYTKAADMGADLVGKTEAHIPEDDPRNPATIADNVGDNVGDVAGLGSDLLESYVGAIIASITLAAYMYLHPSIPISEQLISKLLSYPIILSSIGIISCVIGIAYLSFKKVSDKPHRELNVSMWTSAFLTVVGSGILTYFYFKDIDVSSVGFKAGAMSPWLASVLGILCGMEMGWIAEYYTSYDYKPTQSLSYASLEGTALTITEGMALGMKSTFLPVALLGFTIIFASMIAGIYGVTMAALGMLSFVSATVSIDTYGPIADNAGGICEMSKLEPEVRQITDKLDSVGNTTAAIGKGFAIGSAALAAMSLLSSYIYSQPVAQSSEEMVGGLDLILNMINPLTLTGAIVGAALPYYFSGMLIESVTKAAREMVQEVRRQFKEMPGILTGKVRPDYKTCIQISSESALRQMLLPALISVLTPIISGFIFGADFVGGLLVGTVISSIMLALYTANAGGAWDNSKKFIESGMVEGASKGTAAHQSAIIGDTVGDPLKDTVGPSLDILIKIMSVVSLITVSIFGKYNLFSLFNLFSK
ncbi:MAG TPA: sodium-translocating pyrophosphatase [Firmicutes bacterium]|nr:sodium-translocating pyrophosphatase [Bacillota bacterium]